jgi:hypothetical protein
MRTRTTPNEDEVRHFLKILRTPHPEPEFSDVVRRAFNTFNKVLAMIGNYDDRCMKVALVTALSELGYEISIRPRDGQAG